MMTERQRTKTEKVMGAVAIALALAMFAQYYFLVQGIEDRAECQARHNTEVAKVIKVRSDIVTEILANQDRLIFGVARLQVDEETPEQERANDAKMRKLFRDYIATHDRLTEERAANQVPELPDCV